MSLTKVVLRGREPCAPAMREPFLQLTAAIAGPKLLVNRGVVRFEYACLTVTAVCDRNHGPEAILVC
jgi:hypothetical protein